VFSARRIRRHGRPALLGEVDIESIRGQIVRWVAPPEAVAVDVVLDRGNPAGLIAERAKALSCPVLTLRH
jgi:hypothetical protein